MRNSETLLLDDVFLQPWFLPQKTAFAIRNMLPPEHRHKMRFYFDDHGCLKCEKTKVRYGSNGLCKPCAQHVKLKLFWSVKRRWTAASPLNQPRTFKRIADAQAMLKDLVGIPKRQKRTTSPTNSRGDCGG
jgi:hypothetical protein